MNSSTSRGRQVSRKLVAIQRSPPLNTGTIAHNCNTISAITPYLKN